MKELTILRAALADAWDIDARTAIQRGIDELESWLAEQNTVKMAVVQKERAA